MNKQHFNLYKETELEYFNNFLKELYNYNLNPENEEYNDIHIDQSDPGFATIEWVQTPRDRQAAEYGKHFECIDYYDEIATEAHFPDDHYELVIKGTENEAIKEWLKYNPDWELTSYGTWTNQEENRQSNIEYHLDKWLNKKEDATDLTFKTKIIKSNKLVGEKLNKILTKYIPGDVLYRTSYIVINPDLVDAYYRCFEPISMETTRLANEGEIRPLGDIKISFKYKQGTVEMPIDNILHVYAAYSWPSEYRSRQLVCLTDSHYLIFALDKAEEI